MKDAFNREIDYVRLSLTDRCDLRCTCACQQQVFAFKKSSF